MRVIAGIAKGRPLHAPKSTTTRPTSDKIKGVIFSMLETLLLANLPETEDGYSMDEVWKGVRVLDLYSGSGALAIEALSRGAAWADLVEANQSACRVIRRNLEVTGLDVRARLLCTTVLNALETDSVLRGRERYDIIALDPPYADPSIERVVRLIGSSGLLRGHKLVVVEHSRRVSLAEEFGTLARIRERTHGDTSVSIYCNLEEAS